LQLPSFLLAKERVNERSPVRTGLGIPLSGKQERRKRMFRTLKVSNPSLCGNFVRHFLKAISLAVLAAPLVFIWAI